MNEYGYGPYDGDWYHDPLDLRCIRLDAELEERAKLEIEEEDDDE